MKCVDSSMFSNWFMHINLFSCVHCVFQIMAGHEDSQDQHKHLAGTCMGMCPNEEVRL